MAQLNHRATSASREATRSGGSGSGNASNSGGIDRRVSAAVFKPSRQRPHDVTRHSFNAAKVRIVLTSSSNEAILTVSR